MPNNKIKSSRKIRVDSAHPYSRKANQAKRAMLRDDKIAKKKGERDVLIKNPKVERALWFKFACDPEAKLLSKDQMYELIDMYLSRHDAELESLRLTRQGKQHTAKPSSREAFITALIEKEKKEFSTAGIEIPDLSNGKNLSYLRTWEGDINCIQQIKTIRLKPSPVLPSADICVSLPSPPTPLPLQRRTSIQNEPSSPLCSGVKAPPPTPIIQAFGVQVNSEGVRTRKVSLNTQRKEIEKKILENIQEGTMAVDDVEMT